jgi:hypothetical protein
VTTILASGIPLKFIFSKQVLVFIFSMPTIQYNALQNLGKRDDIMRAVRFYFFDRIKDLVKHHHYKNLICMNKSIW